MEGLVLLPHQIPRRYAPSLVQVINEKAATVGNLGDLCYITLLSQLSDLRVEIGAGARTVFDEQNFDRISITVWHEERKPGPWGVGIDALLEFDPHGNYNVEVQNPNGTVYNIQVKTPIHQRLTFRQNTQVNTIAKDNVGYLDYAREFTRVEGLSEEDLANFSHLLNLLGIQFIKGNGTVSVKYMQTPKTTDSKRIEQAVYWADHMGFRYSAHMNSNVEHMRLTSAHIWNADSTGFAYVMERDSFIIPKRMIPPLSLEDIRRMEHFFDRSIGFPLGMLDWKVEHFEFSGKYCKTMPRTRSVRY